MTQPTHTHNQQGGKFVQYLHITENEVEYEVD
jgi:hypothetical protein